MDGVQPISSRGDKTSDGLPKSNMKERGKRKQIAFFAHKNRNGGAGGADAG